MTIDIDSVKARLVPCTCGMEDVFMERTCDANPDMPDGVQWQFVHHLPKCDRVLILHPERSSFNLQIYRKTFTLKVTR